MKAFVTGGTGLLGSNLVRLLIEQGYDVVALVRSKQKASQLLQGLNVTFVQGDMLDVDGFSQELAGCDVLFHTAAYFREYYQPGNHWQMLEDINIKGTIKLLNAAEKQGIKKVIYVSSAGQIGMNPGDLPGDESTPVDAQLISNLYMKSKALAEEAIYEFLQSHSLSLVLISPGWMFGPYDAAPTGAGQLVLDFVNRKMPGILDGGTCIVDARDVAQAMINAVERGSSCERYITAGQFYTLEQLFHKLEQVSDTPSPKFRIPYKLSLLLAWFSDAYAKLANTKSMLPLDGIRLMYRKRKVSSAKAIKELGVTFRPLETTLKDVIEWYRSAGVL